MSILERIQPHTVKIYNLSEQANEQWVDARSLLHPTRFDLFAKLYYIRERKEALADAIKIYKEHIRAFNPDFKEPGRDDKDGFDNFLCAFECLIDEFETHDFDSARSLVPVTDKGVILDGAHRIATLAYYDRQVAVAQYKGIREKMTFDYQYFKNRGLSWNTMDIIALEMTRWVPNLHIACLWPKMKDKSRAEVSIGQRFGIVYEKSLRVNFGSFRHLIAQVYQNQHWVKDKESVNDKSLQSYGFNGSVLFVFFVAEQLDDVLALKEQIRDMYGYGKHSLHITDNLIEMQELAKRILDEKVLRDWNTPSKMEGIREKLSERWFYFKRVQLINLKVFVANVLRIKR